MMLTHDDIFNPVKGKEHQLIDLYTEFYGEQYRERVTERINNTEFIFVSSTPQKDIAMAYEKLQQRVDMEFCKEVKLDYDKFTDLLDNLEQIRDGIENKNFENYYVQEFLTRGEVNLELLKQEQIYSNLLSKVNNLLEIKTLKYDEQYKQLSREYMQYARPFIAEEQELSKIKTEKAKRLDDCLNKSIAEIEGLDIKKCKDFTDVYKSLQAFSKEKLLDDLVVTPYMKSKFIQAFKAMGVDYGYDYERYIKDEKLMDKIYNHKYKHEQDKIVREYQRNRLKHNSLFIKALNQINNLDIKGGNEVFVNNLISYMYNTDDVKPSAYVMHYVDSNNQLKSICVCSLGTNLSTELFIHETGHIIQSDVHFQDDNDLVVKMGFDLVINHYTHTNFDIDKYSPEQRTDKEYKRRKWETGNEVIHDFLMNMLAYFAQQKGFNIGIGEKEPLLYLFAFPLVKDFIFENERLIKDCQVSEEFELNKIMGQQEYNRLFDIIDTLVYHVKNNYSQIIQEIGGVVDLNSNPSLFDVAYMDHEWSEVTRKYLGCYVEADEIFNRFRQTQQEMYNQQ